MADPNDIDSVLAAIAGTDFGKDMLDTLTSLGKMPKITQGSVTSSDASGEYDPAKNTIALDPPYSLSGSNLKNALMHELTHALNTNMSAAVFQPDSAVDKDTKEQISKFGDPKTYGPMAALINKAKPNDYYRSSYVESSAYGVGNSNFPTYSSNVPHADASRAQEEAIELDLFRRGVQKKAAPPTTKPSVGIIDKILSFL